MHKEGVARVETGQEVEKKWKKSKAKKEREEELMISLTTEHENRREQYKFKKISSFAVS